MALLLDTNVAILLRDGDPQTIERFRSGGRFSLSLISVVELEGGVHARPDRRESRRRSVDALLRRVEVLPFDGQVVETYGRILSATGFSRRRILDRLIAATAIVHHLPLATSNAADFRDIPGLRLELWPAPQ